MTTEKMTTEKMKNGKNKRTAILCIALALCMVLTATFAVSADDGVNRRKVAQLEAEASAALSALQTAEPAPLTEPLSLSFEDALKQMEGSVQMQMINIQAMGDKAAAAGATEGLKSIKNAKDALESSKQALITNPGDMEAAAEYQIADATYSAAASSKKELEMMKAFATSMLEPNDTARKNSLNLSSTEMYFNLKNMEAQAKIAADNADIFKTIYEKTKLKYDKGTVSKMELLNAETDMNKANDTKLAAENGLAQMKMAFNLFFGYNLNQDITLVSELEKTPISEISLEDGIKSALENRNEIKEADYQLKMAAWNYSEYRAYPSTSSKHLGGEAAYLAVKANSDTIADRVEMDVRTRYMTMQEKAQALTTAEKTEANAKETARLAQLQYDSGYCTQTAVQQAQLGSYSAQIAKAQALLDLKLAVEEYELSVGFGKEAASLN